jgi:hypothetical protein
MGVAGGFGTQAEDVWFTVADAEAESYLRDQLRHHSLSGLLQLTAAFCLWNGSPRSFPPAHLVLQKLATLAEGGGPRRVTVPVVDRALRTMFRAYLQGADGIADDPASDERPVDVRMPEGVAMRAAARLITNPGTPGQMILYSIQKFEPFSRELQELLGFDSRRACATVRVVQEGVLTKLAPFLVRGQPPYDRLVGERRGASNI